MPSRRGWYYGNVRVNVRRLGISDQFGFERRFRRLPASSGNKYRHPETSQPKRSVHGFAGPCLGRRALGSSCGCKRMYSVPCHLRRQKTRSCSGVLVQIKATPVLPCNSSTSTPGANSTNFNPSGVMSITARSVMMRLTTPTPVRGNVHQAEDFLLAVLRGVLHQSPPPA